MSGILQKLLKYWTIRRRDDRPSNPATQRIILEIDWFLKMMVKSCLVTVMQLRCNQHFCIKKSLTTKNLLPIQSSTVTRSLQSPTKSGTLLSHEKIMMFSINSKDKNRKEPNMFESHKYVHRNLLLICQFRMQQNDRIFILQFKSWW